MKKIIIVGAGGFGREVLQIIKDINQVQPQWLIKGFINDIENALVNFDCSHSIVGSIVGWKPAEDEVFVCAIGNPSDRENVVKSLKDKGAVFVNVIHPTAIVADNCQIGNGIIMYPYSKVNVNGRVGDFVTIASSSSIGHDVQIGDFTSVSANCVISGRVEISERVFIGPGSVVIPDIKISDDAFVVAGSVVFKNVLNGQKVMGNPARSFLPTNKYIEDE